MTFTPTLFPRILLAHDVGTRRDRCDTGSELARGSLFPFQTGLSHVPTPGAQETLVQLGRPNVLVNFVLPLFIQQITGEYLGDESHDMHESSGEVAFVEDGHDVAYREPHSPRLVGLPLADEPENISELGASLTPPAANLGIDVTLCFSRHFFHCG